ncbi:MAG TPA: pyridoxamine 5'-phosphate oxidase family protein [Galbitalea sp.]|jgi:general stress protein 26
MTHAEEIAKVAELAKKARIAVLTTVDHTGALVSRPLGMQNTDFDGQLWFFTQDPSPKVDDIMANPNVNVSFQSGNGWVSVAGTASVSRDQHKIDELWNKFAEAWFEQGREDPTIALIRVDANTVEYWDADEPRAVTLLKTVTAMVSGGTPDVPDSKTIGL